MAEGFLRLAAARSKQNVRVPGACFFAKTGLQYYATICTKFLKMRAGLFDSNIIFMENTVTLADYTVSLNKAARCVRGGVRVGFGLV